MQDLHGLPTRLVPRGVHLVVTGMKVIGNIKLQLKLLHWTVTSL